MKRSGPHQALLVVYALFALAAGARSLVQLVNDYANTHGGRLPGGATADLPRNLALTERWTARAMAG